ncbi:MAG: hypothetical protein M1829_002736 [Trizodia sp. TS-e1964]|nr:MAG: hypothetical protein M1829_002736 [Trizodia sp. TS-e1964]
MDPEFMEFIKDMPAQEAPENLQALREEIRGVSAALNALDPAASVGVKEADQLIPSRDATQIPIRVYSPAESSAPGPVFVMFHGGGFFAGDLDTDPLPCRRLCQKLGFVVVDVDYRLAPEHPFPAAINDAWDAIKWVAANVSSLNVDPAKGFIIGGASAGAGLAASATILARDEKLNPPLTGLYLSIPLVLSPYAYPEKYKPELLSYEQNLDAPILNGQIMNMIYDLYKPDHYSPLYSSILDPKGLKGFPPTFLQICGLDPLRDEGLLFERILREENNINTRLHIYPGLPHGFFAWFPALKSTKKFQAEFLEGSSWLLGEGTK